MLLSDSNTLALSSQLIRNAASSIGIELPAELRINEHVRFSTNGKLNDTAGWYVISEVHHSCIRLQLCDNRKNLYKLFFLTAST